MTKHQEMERLKKEAFAALKCHETRPGQSAVWGEGSLNAAIALVGEAPGEVEEQEGRPFVGPAGALLDRILESVGLERSDLWITNIVKCRPAVESSGRTVNRSPRVGEVRANISFLERELDIIRPRVIVCVGAVAAKTLIGKDFKLSEQRGLVLDRQGTPILATFHPAYLLRVLSIDRPAYDRLEQDVKDDLSLASRLANEAGFQGPGYVQASFDNQPPLL
jgi:uracil-DNA glycosylase